MSARKLSATAVRRLVRVGQRGRDRREGRVVAIYQVHRGDRLVETFTDGDGKSASSSRSAIRLGELGSQRQLLAPSETEAA